MTRCAPGHVVGHAFLANRYGREIANAGDEEFCRVCDHGLDCHVDQGRGLDSAFDRETLAPWVGVPWDYGDPRSNR